jgi:chromate transporter
MIHDETVVRRRWFTEAQFLEGVAICEMLPGPASTQMGIYTGYLRAGQLGALVTGICFILPAFLIVLALSWAYFRFQGVPQVEDLFLGVAPVVVAIILGFCWKLAKRAIQDWQGGAIALVALFSIFFRANVLLLFLLAGLVGLVIYRSQTPPDSPEPSSPRGFLWPLLPLGPLFSHRLATIPAATLTLSSFWGLERIQEFVLPLALFFLKVGSVIFGGGLVIIPLLEFEVVHQFHWLTQNEFMNGVVLGELTPGPVVITAAFVGYKVAGALGALVATIAIFTPSFLLIMGTAPFLVRVRQHPWAQSFLKGVTPAALGSITAAALPLARAAILQRTLAGSTLAAMIGLVALVALVQFKRPTWQLVPAGALVGLLGGTFL